MKRLISLVLCVVALTPPLMAGVQGGMPQSLFESYSTLNGMPHNRVSDIYTDSQGFVWVCTWYGVSRFDGYTFKNYSTSPGDSSPLSHNRFLSVSEDSNGHLWFKVYNHHIYRFNRYTEQFEDPAALLEGLDAKHYRAAQRRHDSRGRTWVVIPGEGVARFDSSPDAEPLRAALWLCRNERLKEVVDCRLDAEDNLWLYGPAGEIWTIGADDEEPHLLGSAEEPILDMTFVEGVPYFLGREKLLRYDEKGAVELVARGEHFSALAADTCHKMLYVGSRTGRLFRFNTARSEWQAVATAQAPLARIRALESDSHGILWITTSEAGITRYNPLTDNCKHFYQEPYTVSYNIDTLPKLAESGDRLWIKMNHYGFGYYDRENDRVEPFYNDPSRSECLMTNAVVRFDVQDEVLWLSTYYERGLRRAVLLEQPADMLTVDTRFDDDFSNEIRALMTDRRGRVWVGTKTGELLCYSAENRLEARYPEHKGEMDGIYALKEDSQGRIWVGTRYRGLYLMQPEGEGYRIARHFSHSPTDSWSLSCDHIYSIEEDDLGRIWVATYGGGVNLYDEANDRFCHAGNLLGGYPLAEADRVRWLLNDGRGRMLAATVDGLVIFRPEENLHRITFSLVQRRPGDAESLGNNDIIHMMRDSHGHILLATYGGGLNRIEGYNEKGEPRFRTFDMTDGLPSNICLSVTEDMAGYIWVATQNAVSILDEESGNFTNHILYDNHTSASFSEATVTLAPDGRVLFGAGSNIFAFHPDQPVATEPEYRLHFTGLMVNNQPARVGEDEPLSESITTASRIDLYHNYSNFRIDFAALNFSCQNEVGYMYRLEGYDSEWNVVGRMNSASYSNVPSGSYTFRVKAYRGSTADPGEERTIKVVIHPPFWASWWAKCFYLLLAGGVVWVVLRMVNSLQRIRRESQVEQEMTDLKLQFFTNISHELRTPLTLILGGIEDARKHEELSQRSNISLNLAHKNARRMLTMINQLLDFRKIVKEKMELKISRVNLVPLMEDIIEDFRKLAAERQIQLLFTVSHRSILVWVDIERIESVIYNLLSNAFKFTRNGGRVEVILTLDAAQESVLMTVKDNGIGIARDQQSAIFERFHQASRSVEGQQGSGIGLSLCREIVALHHGDIAVESRPGEGSAFTVKLRTGNGHFGMEQINFGDGGEEKSTALLVSDYTTTDSDRRTDVTPPEESPKVLLVDDNRELRLFMYNHLIENYRVIEAEDGVEALATIRREVPDIVITDLMMPNMDGIELINRVRNDFSISHIPMIMLTAKHSPDERIKAMEFGADGYITKPFAIELLQARIDNLLTQRRTLFEKYSSPSVADQKVRIDPEEVVVTDKDEAFINNVMEWLRNNSDNSELTIDQMAAHLGLSRTTLYNKLKSMTGQSPVEMVKQYRLKRAFMLLKTGQLSVSEVAYRVGFSDPGYFSRCFKEQFHIAPAEFVKRQREGVDFDQLMQEEFNQNKR